MIDINEIMNMLDWHMPLGVQTEGRKMAEKTEMITPFIQPLTPRHNKNVWDNCALVIAQKKDAELDPYLFGLLEWIQDMNWPGAVCIQRRLKKYANKKLLYGVVSECILKAKECGDEQWEHNLSILMHAGNDMI